MGRQTRPARLTGQPRRLPQAPHSSEKVQARPICIGRAWRPCGKKVRQNAYFTTIDSWSRSVSRRFSIRLRFGLPKKPR